MRYKGGGFLVKSKSSLVKEKMQHQPNKKYKDLKQKQKAKIADWMFLETKRFFRENGRMPVEGEIEELAKSIYEKICSLTIWIPYEELLKEYIKKLPRYVERVKEKGAAEMVEEKKEKPVIKTAKRRRKKIETLTEEIEQDETFYYIAGYTSCGAPYGVTWEEMGLNPYESIE